MQLTSTTFDDGGRLPDRCAFGVPDDVRHMRFGPNRNPALAWSGVPEGTRSLVLLCIDIDVPSSGENFNREGRSIDADLARVEFVHWVMVDIAPDTEGIAEGECSDGVVAGGTRNPPGPPGSRQGLTDYTGFMADDPDMRGDYFGYEGPCPPWNDERVHRYRFTLIATDLERCPVDGRFTADEVRTAVAGHVLGEAELTGTYTLNPALR